MRIMLSLLWAAGIALLVMTFATPIRGNDAIRADDGNGNPINGRKVFLRENCYICHGGRAGGGMCPSFRDDPPDESDVEDFVLNGSRTGMPSFRGRVTSQEIADIAAYFQTLRSAQEPTFTHWWEAVPTQ